MEVITSRQNSLMTRVVKLQTSKKYRQAQGVFVGDGTKLLEEAVKWIPDALEAVILREGIKCPDLPGHVRTVQVSRQLMEQISQMEAPEGAIFICKVPENANNAVPVKGCLVLDGIQDPGNVGTILRTADALDIPVLLTEGCCDPYNPKTVRATMGAIFRTTPGSITREALLRETRNRNIPLYATALSDSARDLRELDLKGAAVIIGSEGQGVSPALLEGSDGQVIIPMHKRCESLNAAVAAAIVMWQMTNL